MTLNASGKTPLQLSRLEISIAEVFRTNTPIGYNNAESEFWMDLMEAFAEMLATGKPRFNQDAFYQRCFGEEEGDSEFARELSLFDRGAARFTEVKPEVNLG
jgi:hypothetical protein